MGKAQIARALIWTSSVAFWATLGCGSEGAAESETTATSSGGKSATPGTGGKSATPGTGGKMATGIGGKSSMPEPGGGMPAQGAAQAVSNGGASGGGPATAGAGGQAAAGAASGPDPMNEPPQATPPANCGEAAAPYELVITALDPSFVPAAAERQWSGEAAQVPVAVSNDGEVSIGFTRVSGASRSAVIVRPGSKAGDGIVLEDAALGGIVATVDGTGALLFDPNTDEDARTWAAVARLGANGEQVFRSDLFRSPNLDDVDTKGGASSGRIGYVAENNELYAYFGHTQRYQDGVRHQGGYLASIDAAGSQTVLGDWYGSHNLSQRLLVDGPRVAVLGLGDAFPKGIFFNYAEGNRLRPQVIYRLAADGVGSTNGQLGGMVDLGTDIAIPFITNRSVSQDLDAGAWPNTDEAISKQIRDAAAAGTDLGLLIAPKTRLPEGDLAVTWIDAQPTASARLSSLRSVIYGPDLILLAWAELTGSSRRGSSSSSSFFTMVLDRQGNVCQPKTALPEGHGFAAGDDLVLAPDGSILWANATGGGIQLIRLLP